MGAGEYNLSQVNFLQSSVEPFKLEFNSWQYDQLIALVPVLQIKNNQKQN